MKTSVRGIYVPFQFVIAGSTVLQAGIELTTNSVSSEIIDCILEGEDPFVLLSDDESFQEELGGYQAELGTDPLVEIQYNGGAELTNTAIDFGTCGFNVSELSGVITIDVVRDGYIGVYSNGALIKQGYTEDGEYDIVAFMEGCESCASVSRRLSINSDHDIVQRDDEHGLSLPPKLTVDVIKSISEQ